MASNRHLGRIIALQSLYEYEFRNMVGDPAADIEEIIAKNIEPYGKALGDTEFVLNLTKGVWDDVEQLDAELQPLAPDWPFDTISAVDRNILRIGFFELTRHSDAVPPKVAINEAVELAKAFGAENSSKFVNGVLGTAFRKIIGGEEVTNAGKKSKKSASRPESTEEDDVRPSFGAQQDAVVPEPSGESEDTGSDSDATV